MKIEYIGHAGFVLCDESNSKNRVYIDPAISIAGGDVSEHHPSVILLTHGHGDHVGDAVALLKQNPRARLYAIVELAELVGAEAGAEGRCIGCNKGGCVDLGLEGGGWSAVLVDAKHSSSYRNGEYAGEACGWVVRGPGGDAVYHTGDTDVFPGMGDICDLHRPATALVCIGGHYTMGPQTAAYAVAKYLSRSVRTVVPMHFGTWPILAGTPAQLVDALAAQAPAAPVAVVPLKLGASITV